MEKAGKLSPADEIKLTKMRLDPSAGGENAAEEFERLLKLEKAGKLSPAGKIKLTNMRASRFDGVSEGQKADWNRMYALLCAYKEENGDCLVPQHSGNVSKLAAWVNTQRAQYKLKDAGKPSNLSDERKALLDEIGFTYRVTLPWGDRFQQLEKVGSCSKSAILSSDRRLCQWCSRQVEIRQQWRKKEREYQRELSSWKNSGRRGDRPKRRDQTKYETWIKREERLGQLGFWEQFRNT